VRLSRFATGDEGGTNFPHFEDEVYLVNERNRDCETGGRTGGCSILIQHGVR
jgi:hypothetical protein